MPSVLDRSALEQSPLADLHLLANELGVDGFRRLRKSELVDAIFERQGGEAEAPEPAAAAPEPEPEPTPAAAVAEPTPAEVADGEQKRSRRGRRGGRGRKRDGDEGEAVMVDRDEPPAEDRGGREDRVVEGVVELLSNGSGFVRLAPPDETDDDVYISAAQVKRCELVSGDRVGGPMRAPRRSERFPSLIRVDTINGRPAEEVAEGTRFEDLAVTWPDERIELGSDDPTVKAVEWLTPFGKGSRVVISGPSRSGKSEALRRLTAALAAREGLELTVVLAGVRPEEADGWPVAPSATLTFASSTDAQAQAIEQAVEQGRRVAARGGDAVVLVDTLEYLPGAAARRALGAARNLRDGGSLTVIATSPLPVGGETTVVSLDPLAASLGRYPALALVASGTLRPELLVGAAGAAAIKAARAEQAGVEAVVQTVVVPEPVAAPEPEPEPEPELVAEPEPEAAAAPAKAKAKTKAKAKKPAAKRAPRKPAAAKRKAVDD